MPEARIDLLNPIDLIEQKSVNDILTEIGEDAEIANISPSDPAGRIARGWAIREQKRRAQENENAKGQLLAFAKGDRLDLIAETFYRNADGSKINRKPDESDDEFRLALQESPEGLTSAGTLKSYDFHASRSHALTNRNTVRSYSPEPMVMYTYFIIEDDLLVTEVKESIESNVSNFTPGGDIFSAIRATKNPYAILATVKVKRGVVLDMVKAQGKLALDKYLEEVKRIGGVVSFSSISSALTVPGVIQVPIPDGWIDVECTPSEYPSLTLLTLNYEVI